jgi:hypothetical protein
MNDLAKVTTTAVVVSNVEAFRKAAAQRIGALMRDWTANTLALAAELAKAAETFPSSPKRAYRQGFDKWARKETGLSSSQINNLLHVHQKFGHREQGTIHLGGAVMILLARSKVPETARQEALDRAEKGEHISRIGAKKIIKAHKLPTPKAANEQAKNEGHPVLASDGYIYFGTDPGRAKEGEDRRTMVYGVRKALETLGSIHLTGRQFMAYALPHQLWSADEAKIIKKALHWLQSLDEAWDSRDA